MRFSKSKKWWNRRYKIERSFIHYLNLHRIEWVIFYETNPILARMWFRIAYGPSLPTSFLGESVAFSVFSDPEKAATKMLRVKYSEKMADWAREFINDMMGIGPDASDSGK